MGGLLGTRTKSAQLPLVVCNALHRYEGVDMNDSQDFSLGAPRSSNLEPGLLVAGCWLAGVDDWGSRLRWLLRDLNGRTKAWEKDRAFMRLYYYIIILFIIIL